MAHHGVALRRAPRGRPRAHARDAGALDRRRGELRRRARAASSRSWSWPKPVQRPRPPVLLGGAAGPEAVRAHRRVRATGGSRSAARASGRSCPTCSTLFEEAGPRPRRRSASCRSGPIPDPGKLEYYASLGVDEVVLRLPSRRRRRRVAAVLDEYSALVGVVSRAAACGSASLGAARIAPAAMIKPARNGRRSRGRRGRGPRSQPGRGVRVEARHPDGARHLRRAARRSRHRRDLQPAAERPARRVDDRRRSRPASTCCARSRSPRTPPRPRQVAAVADAHRPRRDGGVPLPLPPARAAHARDRRRAASSARSGTSRPRSCFPLPEVLRHPLPVRPRRRRARWTSAATPCTMRRAARRRRARGRPRAEAKLRSPDVDRCDARRAAVPRAVTPARITCSMWSSSSSDVALRVTGDRGELRVINPTGPQFWHRIA